MTMPLPSRGPERTRRSSGVVGRAAARTLASGLALALTGLAFLPGCSEKSPPASTRAIPAPEDPNVVLVVDGIEVTRDELERSLYFQRLAYPGQAPLQWLQRALNDDLIPLAAIRARYARDIQAKTVELENALNLVRQGANFGQLQQSFTFQDADYRRRSEGWHYASSFRLANQGLAAMETPVGEVAGPFVTLAGVHLMMIEDKIPGDPVQGDKVKIRQIIVQFEKLADMGKIDEATRAAHVQAVHPDYKDFIRPDYLYRFAPTTGVTGG